MSIKLRYIYYFLISVGFGGISFGRFDWVQNISGGQLSFIFFTIFILLILMRQQIKIHINQSFKLFLYWFFSSVLSLYASVFFENTSANIALLFMRELVVCFIIFCAGYLSYKYVGNSFKILQVSLPWIFGCLSAI